MRILGTILLTLVVTIGFSQVDPEQIYQAPGRDYVLLSTDTLNSSYPINGIYVPTRLKDSIFFKADSICISIFDDGRPEKCLLMPEGGGGSSDTLSYWIFQVNGGVDDTIYQAERINLVAGTRITITGGTDNPTINADSCLQRLEQLTDSTFQITDCAGSPLDTILIPIPEGGGVGTDDQEITQFEISNDTIYLTLEDGGGQKFLVVQHPDTCFHSAEAVTDSSFQILDCNGVPLDTVTLRFDGENDLNWAYDNLTFSGNRTHTLGGFDLRVDGPGDVRWIDVTDYVIDADAAVTVNGDDAVSITSLFGDIQSFSVGGDNRMIAADTIKLNSTAGLYEFGTGTSAFNLPPINDTLQYAIAVDTNTGRWYLRDVSTAETAPDSLEYRGDSIAIIGSNALRIFDLIDTTGWGVDIDTDSQSLSIVDHTLSISRGNSVVLPDTVAPSQIISIDGDTITLSAGGGSVVIQHPPSADTVKLKPFHEVWTNSDSTLTVNAGFDTLVTYNDSIRWKLLDNRIDAIALGKGARSDHYNSTALGARAFPYLQDTLVHPFNSTQVDTANEWIDGLGSFITHLNDLGYQTGDIVVIKWSLTSGEMPFIDTAQDLRVAEGIHAFTITSPSLLSPVQFGFDSVPTGAYTLQANQYLTGSTAIGHDAVVDKANQIALGDSTSQELKLGDSIRMKIDTNYTHFQLVGFDSTYNQLIPIDAAAFGFTPDADFWEIGVDASPGSITDNTYTLGQTVFAADTSVNSYYVQVVPPNGDGINVRDPFSDDVDIMWSGTTYSWAWRLENDAFFLQDAGDPGVGTGVYISAINGYDGGAAILELQPDGGMQWSNYGIGSPRDGGSDFYAIPFVDGGGGVYQLRPDDFLDSLDLSDIGDSSGVVIPTGQVFFGTNTRAPEGSDSLFWDQTSGKLGVGTSSPSEKIHVYDAIPTRSPGILVEAGTSNFFKLASGATATAIFYDEDNFMVFTPGSSTSDVTATQATSIAIEGTNGNLGVGTWSPSAKLHVDGTVRLDNLAADGVSGVLYYDAENDIGKRSLANLQSDLGVLWTDGGTTSYLTSTSDRVHIGGTSAARKLQVTQNTTSNVGLIRLENTSTGDATLELGAGGIYGAIGMDNSGDLIIAHHDNVDASRAIFVDASANVGIAISPSYRLDVNGTFHASGAWYDSSGDAGSSGQVLSSTGSTSNWVDVVDNSITNEIQTFAFSAPATTTWQATLSDGGGTMQIVEGNGIDVQPSGGTATIEHGNTSSQASVNNSGSTFIQDITLDAFGHITAITSAVASGGSSEWTNRTSYLTPNVAGVVAGATGAVGMDGADLRVYASSPILQLYNSSGSNSTVEGKNTGGLLGDINFFDQGTGGGISLRSAYNSTSVATGLQVQNDGDVLLAHDGGLANDQMLIVSTNNSDVRLGHEDHIANYYSRYNDDGTINIVGNGQISISPGSSGNLVMEGNINLGPLNSAGSRVIKITNGTAPIGNVLNSIQLYAEDVASSSELKVRDEASNITTLSPHNFSKIPEGPSEEMAWAFYSERDGKYINVDMLKLVRLVEELTGEKLVYTNSK